MSRIPHRIAFIVLSTALLLAALVAAGSASAARGSGATFGPETVPVELHIQRTEAGASTTSHWRGPNRYRFTQTIDLDPVDDRIIFDLNGGTMVMASGTAAAAMDPIIQRNVASVAPDGYSMIDGDMMGWAWPLIAGVRAGTTTLRPLMSNGRPLLRGTIAVAANDCAGFARGTRTVDLDSRTLVPVRVVDRRGGRVTSLVTYRTMSARPGVDFAPLRMLGRREIRDDGFVRRSAAAVDARVSYPVMLPTSVPAGFRLTAVGNAARGGMIGPEASFERSRGVFFARYSLGLENIELTIRPAHGRLAADWDESDPFGGECESTTTQDVQVGAITAKYATGENGAPRMWWRDGTTLFTLRAPFGPTELAAVAASLQPVAPA
jgi:hypothetical protein